MSAESEYREKIITRIAEAFNLPREVVASAARGESVVERSERQAAEIQERMSVAIGEVLDGGFVVSETARRILLTAVGRPVEYCSCVGAYLPHTWNPAVCPPLETT